MAADKNSEQGGMAANNLEPDPAYQDGASNDVRPDRPEMLNVSAAVRLVPLRMSPSAKTGANNESQLCMPLFFNPEEFEMVDELTELIIPADDHSPGAREAKVAAYIDGWLAELFDDEPRERWRNGLNLVDSICEQMHGRRFLRATNEQRIAVLARMSENEANPRRPEELFFNELKLRTARGYYTSKIGIHREMKYKGNVYIREFVGFDAK